MRRIALVLVVLAAMCAPAGASSSDQQGASFERRVDLERDVVRELNKVRRARGLSRLRLQPGLRAAAVTHTRSMLAVGFFAHDPPTGAPFPDRVRRHYPARGWRVWSVGETLLAGSDTLDARGIVTAWLESPSHREIILTPGWREVGIGAFFRPDAPGSFGGAETLAVTAEFGLRERG